MLFDDSTGIAFDADVADDDEGVAVAAVSAVGAGAAVVVGVGVVVDMNPNQLVLWHRLVQFPMMEIPVGTIFL